ncbi:MAG: sensor histidine kinase [Lachnospiraceae bacterium]|jgi:two-component system sensor histidine kinase YesM|nr:sensor histidine kinase [Lachnospiraceae bacterium]RKJ48790.1 sensor histidine kinase [bacterium 1XD42-54]
MSWFKKRWKYIKHYYKQKSMQFTISISFTLVTVIGMALLGIFLLRSYQSAMETLALEDNERLLNQVDINLNSYLRNMMRISDSVYYNSIKQIDFGASGIDNDLNLLYEANKDTLVSLACFSEEGQLISAVPFSSLKPDIDVTEQDWFLKASEKMENLHFSDIHVQNLFDNSSDRYYWVISLSRGVEITRNGSLESGILLVDMDFSGIQQLFTKVNIQSPGYVYLVDSNGKLIYHPKQNLIFSNLIEENNIQDAALEDGIHKESFHGEERMLVVKTVGYTGWKIISVTPIKRLYGTFFRSQLMAFLVVAIAILVMIFLNQLVSVRVVKPLKRLENSVKEIDFSPTPQIYIGGPHEIQHLGKTIQSMVVEMRRLTDDIVREQEEKRKSELDALQSQINPHFLYNTLDSIMWMIEAEKYEDAISMVQALGSLFRISLSKGKTLITIEDEIRHAQSYVAIQKYRYKNRFEAFFDVDNSLTHYKTIKLIIQPLIENAIYYGMEFMDGDGEIHIRVKPDGADLSIEVADNGPGIPTERLSSLLTEETRERSRGSGIGLRNVHQRIQLYFGSAYGLEIESEPDEGTLVRIRLPLCEDTVEKIKEEAIL